MNDDVTCTGCGEYVGSPIADRIDELEAKLNKAVEGLIIIDALDPEGLIEGCSQSALTGLVLRMGEIARTTIEAIKGDAE